MISIHLFKVTEKAHKRFGFYSYAVADHCDECCEDGDTVEIGRGLLLGWIGISVGREHDSGKTA